MSGFRKEIIDISSEDINSLEEKAKKEILYREQDGYKVDSVGRYVEKLSLCPYHIVYTISKFEE